MASNRTSSSRPGLVHCPHCGEDYSSAYKRCPFCQDRGDDYETERPVRRAAGGKRLASGSSGQGSYAGVSPLQILSIVFSLAVIVAAVWIVATKLMPVIQRGEVESISSSQGDTAGNETDPDGSTDHSGTPDGTPDGNQDGTPDGEGDGLGSPAPDGEGLLPAGTEITPPPETVPTPAPASNEASSFRLGSSDVTLEFKGQLWNPVVTFSPEGTAADLIWESDDTSVAAVSNGTVTAVGQGTTNISAMLPNGYTQTCIVRCKWDESSAAPEPTQNSSSSGYTTNNPDFTFYYEGETFRLAVKNYSGSVTWSSSNTSVASVDSDGTCRAVATGTCTITGTLEDGSTVTAIARVDLSGG